MKHLKIIYCFLLVFSILICCTGGVFAEFAAIPTLNNMYSFLESAYSIENNTYSRSVIGGLYWILDRVDTYLSSISQGLNNVNSNVNYWGELINNNAASISSRVYTLNDTIKYAVFGSTTIDTSKSVYSMISSLQSTLASGNSILADIDLYAPYLAQIDGSIDSMSGNVADIEVSVDGANRNLSSIDGHVDDIESYVDGVEGKLDNLNNDFYGTFQNGWSLSSSNNGRRTSIFEMLLSNYGRLSSINSSVGTITSSLNALNAAVSGLVNGTYRPDWFYGQGQDGQTVSLFNIALSTLNHLDVVHVANRSLVNGQRYSVAAYLDYIANNLNDITISGDLTANVDLTEVTANQYSILNSVNTLSSYIQDNLRSTYNTSALYPVAGNQQYSLGSWARFIYNQSDLIRGSLSAVDGQNYKTVAELSLETNDKLDQVIDLLSQIAPDSSVDTSNKESVINWYNNLNFGDTELGDLALDLPSFDIAIVIPDIDADSKDFPFAEIAAYTAGYFAADANSGGW